MDGVPSELPVRVFVTDRRRRNRPSSVVHPRVSKRPATDRVRRQSTVRVVLRSYRRSAVPLRVGCPTGRCSSRTPHAPGRTWARAATPPAAPAALAPVVRSNAIVAFAAERQVVGAPATSTGGCISAGEITRVGSFNPGLAPHSRLRRPPVRHATLDAKETSWRSSVWTTLASW